MRSALSLLLIAADVVVANQFNVYFPDYQSGPGCECLPWAQAGAAGIKGVTQPLVDALFVNASVPRDAVNCMLPGSASNTGCALVANHPACSATAVAGWAGPFCLCKPSGAATPVAAYCTAPLETPEQINLQYASASVVVAGFVTYDEAMPSLPPMADLSVAGSATAPQQLTGVSHWYVEPVVAGKETGRNYSMHFVKFGGLAPATRYTYRLKSGSATGKWSKPYTFRSARPPPATAIGLFGDIAVSQFNSFGNLLADCESGRIDAFVLMGDHAYNLGDVDDHRGDAYMNAMQPLLATCPWIPVIGNHEAEDGDGTHHYLNITWGEAMANPLGSSTSTATSALGHLLTKGTFLAAGIHGTTPSGSSGHFSVDIGSIHIAALSTHSPVDTELAWLEADLAAAAANRKAVPWIIVTSHYPIYLSTMAENANASSARWHAIEGELADPLAAYMPCEVVGEAAGCRSVADETAQAAATLGDLFLKYGVDIYSAGHSHEYGVTWPMIGGNATQKSYANPGNATVYLVEGNGGVPGVPGTFSLDKPPADWARIHGKGGAYGVVTISDPSVLKYEHNWNNGNGGQGSVGETWSITQDRR